MIPARGSLLTLHSDVSPLRRYATKHIRPLLSISFPQTIQYFLPKITVKHGEKLCLPFQIWSYRNKRKKKEFASDEQIHFRKVGLFYRKSLIHRKANIKSNMSSPL